MTPGMRASTRRRVWGIMYRHLALYRRSWLQLVELAYFPTLQMLIWGFTSTFIVSGGDRQVGSGQAEIVVNLVGAVVLWEVTVRSQLGLTTAFLEEIWAKNFANLMISPLRPVELVGGMIGVSIVRTALGVVPAALCAWVLYRYNILAIGPLILLLLLNLAVMGWWIALVTMFLLLRYGAGAQGFAWSIIVGIAPFAAVFYPVDALPASVRWLSLILPADHVFEVLRAYVQGKGTHWGDLGYAALLNAGWLGVFGSLLARQFRTARRDGLLLNIGE